MKHLDRRQFLELSAAGIGGAAYRRRAPLSRERGRRVAVQARERRLAAAAALDGVRAERSDDLGREHEEVHGRDRRAGPRSSRCPGTTWGPKGALAAQVGSGPDIIMGWNDDPFVYPDKLIDIPIGRTWAARTAAGTTTRAGTVTTGREALGVAAGRVHRQRGELSQELGQGSRPQRVPQGPRRHAEAPARLKKNGHPPVSRWVTRSATRTAGRTGSVGVRRQTGEPGQLDRDQLGRNGERAGVRAAAVRDDDRRRRRLGRLEQQQGLRRRPHRHDDERDQHLVQLYLRHALHLPGLRQRDDPPMGPVKTHTVSNNFTSAFIFKYSKYPNAAKEYCASCSTSRRPSVGHRDEGLRHARSQGVCRAADLDVQLQHHALSRRLASANTTATTASPEKRPRRRSMSS